MTDYESEIIKQVWAIVEAIPQFDNIIQPSNRIKLFANNVTEQESGIDPLKTGWSDADFPEMIVVCPSMSDSMWSVSKGYGSVVPASRKAVTLSYNVAVEITHLNANFYQQRTLDNLIISALRDAGSELGIAAFRVDLPQPLTKRSSISYGRTGEMANAGGMRRLVTVMSLPINVQRLSHQL